MNPTLDEFRRYSDHEQHVAIYTALLELLGEYVPPTPFADLDLSTLPTTNPGGGKPWLNGHIIQIGT